jgi:MFS family permease
MSVGIVVMLIFYCGMGAFFLLTLYLQDGVGYSPLKTALTMLPATFGIVAGNGIGMPMAPRVGRRLPMAGLILLLVGTASMIAVVTRYGSDLTSWQLAVPVLLYGAGLGLGASSLMLITLTGAGGADAGTASGVVNTVVQLGLAAGPATVGTVFFSRLAADGDFVAATQTGLLLGLALFAAALVACFLLPRPASPARATARADIPPDIRAGFGDP